jgi:hypothetical protein
VPVLKIIWRHRAAGGLYQKYGSLSRRRLILNIVFVSFVWFVCFVMKRFVVFLNLVDSVFLKLVSFVNQQLFLLFVVV